MDIQTLIGNASAYLGLILGFTILQLPSFLGHLRERARRLMFFVNQEDEEKEGQDKNISRSSSCHFINSVTCPTIIDQNNKF